MIGRVRLPDVDPAIDAAVDAALAACELEVVDVELPGWDAADDAGWAVMFHEYWVVDRHLYEQRPGRPGRRHRRAHRAGPRRHRPPPTSAARAHRAEWRAELAAAFERAPVLAWPTIAMFPTPHRRARCPTPVAPTSRSTTPATRAWPSRCPTGGRFPASVQLVGPDHSEDLLCATGLVVEAAARTFA